MSTYDDRLATLEQKVTALTHNLVATQGDIFTHLGGFNRTVTTLNSMLSEQEHALKDVHHEITILTGVIGSQGQDIKSIQEDLGAIKASVEALEQSVGNRFEALEQSVNSRFEVQDKKLDQVLSMLSKLTSGSQQET